MSNDANNQSSSSSSFREFEKVEARYRGKMRYYPGRIKRVNRDGTYDIDYDDGEKEMFVAAELIRSLESGGNGNGGGGGGGGAAGGFAAAGGRQTRGIFGLSYAHRNS